MKTGEVIASLKATLVTVIAAVCLLQIFTGCATVEERRNAYVCYECHKQCRACNGKRMVWNDGSVFVEGYFTRCEKCNGSGIDPYKVPLAPGQKHCISCGGLGIVHGAAIPEFWLPCKACGGDGIQKSYHGNDYRYCKDLAPDKEEKSNDSMETDKDGTQKR